MKSDLGIIQQIETGNGVGDNIVLVIPKETSGNFSKRQKRQEYSDSPATPKSPGRRKIRSRRRQSALTSQFGNPLLKNSGADSHPQLLRSGSRRRQSALALRFERSPSKLFQRELIPHGGTATDVIPFRAVAGGVSQFLLCAR